MSETNQTAETSIEMKAKEKEKKDKGNEGVEADPYCCTPGGGGTGPDTKP